MDPFAAILFGGIAVFVIWVVALGRYVPGSGVEQLGMGTSRQIVERREALEAEDLEQMVAAHNRRRAARGEAAVTAEQVEMRVLSENAEQRQRERELQLADRELDELLEATNARRRARGLPERTREQARREFGGGAG